MSKELKRRRALERQRLELLQEWENQDLKFDPLIKPSAIGLGLFILLIYGFTVCPSVPPGDGGEMIAGSYTLGVLHPPGYPLYTMLAKLFSLIPFGTIAWRVNFFSSFCHAVAAVLLFLSVRQWTRSYWSALLASGLFAFSHLTWLYSVYAEVFALNDLIVTLLLYLTVRYSQDQSLRWVFWGAFVFGLGMSNHYIIAFFGIPVFLWIAIFDRKHILNINIMGKICIFFGLGLIPYVYLPVASSFYPSVGWGDQTTLSGFLTHFTRSEYGTFRLSQTTTGGGLVEGIFFYFKVLSGQTLFIGMLIGLFGIFSFCKRAAHTTLIAMWTFAFICFLVSFHSMVNMDYQNNYYLDIIQRMWLMPNTLFFAFVGLGFSSLEFFVYRRFGPISSKVFPILVIVFVGIQIGINFKKADRQEYQVFSHYSKVLLDSLPENSIVFSGGAAKNFPMTYMQVVENYRPDIKIIFRQILNLKWMKNYVERKFPEVTIPRKYFNPLKSHSYKGGYNLKMLFDANYEKAPLFVTAFDGLETYEGRDDSWQGSYRLRPYGFFEQVVKKDQPFDMKQYLAKTTPILESFDRSMVKAYSELSYEKGVLKELQGAYHMQAKTLIVYGIKDTNRSMILKGIQLLTELTERADPPVAEYFRVLGSGYQVLSKREPEYKGDMLRVFRTYLRLASVDDLDYGKIRRIVNKYGNSSR